VNLHGPPVAAPGTLYAMLPQGIDDLDRPSGGNVYDRRLLDGLPVHGWTIRERTVPGAWPEPEQADLQGLGEALGAVPDGATVLVDGLIGSAAADVLIPESARLRQVVLVHLPLGAEGNPAAAVIDGEREVLAAAHRVVATSRWTRSWLMGRYGLAAAHIAVASPGVDGSPPASGTASGGALLCVAAVIPAKGHDLLAGALATLRDLSWQCRCVGSLARQPSFVADVRRQATSAGIADRMHFAGPLTGAALEQAYAAADALVHPSRGETYGMVLVEALARGLPVIGAEVGGVAEAVGRTTDGRLPGLLVPPDDPGALAAALRRWLTDDRLRSELREAAVERRGTLPTWPGTVERVHRVLAEVAA
jgi:glycosyltransferase involved in cell wall biosynthesis